MELMDYIEAVEELVKNKITSEQIICKILEEWGKDRRTGQMEEGKNKRTPYSYIVSDNTEKPHQEPQKPQNEASKTVNPITPGQFKALCLMSKDIEGEEYLKSKGIKSEKDIEKLSKKEAWQIMHDRGN